MFARSSLNPMHISPPTQENPTYEVAISTIYNWRMSKH